MATCSRVDKSCVLVAVSDNDVLHFLWFSQEA